MQCASLCPRKASLEAVMCTCLRCIDPAAPGTMQIADFIIGPATLRWLGLCCVACVGVLSGLCSCRHACESVCMYRGISGMCVCVCERERDRMRVQTDVPFACLERGMWWFYMNYVTRNLRLTNNHTHTMHINTRSNIWFSKRPSGHLWHSN